MHLPHRSRRPAPWTLTLTLALSGWLGPALGATPPMALAMSPSPSDPGVPADVAAALAAAQVPLDAVSLLVLPVEGGAPRLTLHAQAFRQLASVMKLFTTGVALKRLGPTYTWHTDVALGAPLSPRGRLQGPLYLRGGGDPGLVTESVSMMMQQWRAAGLRDIHGDIVVDRRAFDIPAHDPDAFDGEGLRPYNAGADALLLNHQAETLRFMPDATRPGQVRVSLWPDLAGVRLRTHIEVQPFGACGDWREALDLQLHPLGPAHHSGPASGAPAKWEMRVKGPYPASCDAKEWHVLWQGDGPGDHARRLLPVLWRQAGGQLHGEVKDGPWPPQARTWQSWPSRPLGELVRDINKFSNNVMARQLFLSLALPAPAAPSAPGGSAVQATFEPPAPIRAATLDQARTIVTDTVREATRDKAGHTPCAPGALLVDNGAGLSRMAGGSAQCLGRWLQAMWAAPTMPEFIASLPIAGQDGTARKLLSVAGQAHLKTGSLDGVVALAGYVEGQSGRRWAVVGVVNHPQASAARPALEALVGWAVRDR